MCICLYGLNPAFGLPETINVALVLVKKVNLQRVIYYNFRHTFVRGVRENGPRRLSFLVRARQPGAWRRTLICGVCPTNAPPSLPVSLCLQHVHHVGFASEMRTSISCRQLTRATKSCCRRRSLSISFSAIHYSSRASELGGVINGPVYHALWASAFLELSW